MVFSVTPTILSMLALSISNVSNQNIINPLFLNLNFASCGGVDYHLESETRQNGGRRLSMCAAGSGLRQPSSVVSFQLKTSCCQFVYMDRRWSCILTEEVRHTHLSTWDLYRVIKTYPSYQQPAGHLKFKSPTQVNTFGI